MDGTFTLPWSRDHVTAIGKYEDAVLRGGLFALAMPRGSGKTSLAEAAALWAILIGARRYVMLVSADASSASSMLASISTELETNDLLCEDFPEVCFPIAALERINHRCRGQTCEGEPTRMSWTKDRIVLPTIRGSQSSGALIEVAGITGGIRGRKFKTPDGVTVRPDLVLLDDPQTDESARSPSQVATRKKTLMGTILGLAGPNKKIAGIATVTVVAPGDLAEWLLDNETNPQWQGQKTRLLVSFPKSIRLWEEYAKRREESLRAGDRGKSATEFYRENRAAMDEGAEVSWPERFEPGQLSAIQYAMDLKYQDEGAFWAEYQNEPLPLVAESSDSLVATDVMQRTNGIPRRAVPDATTRVTAFVDIQGNSLWYTVCAWSDDMTGSLVDCGTFPDQRRLYFTVSDIRETLARKYPGSDQASQIQQGLSELVAFLASMRLGNSVGDSLSIGRILIDANWGLHNDTVLNFCQTCEQKSIVTPCRGRYIGPAAKPMSELPRKPGDRVGLNWRVPLPKPRQPRWVNFDANFWKSFVGDRMLSAKTDLGAFTLWGDRPDVHRMFADHCVSEFRTRLEGPDRVIDAWKLKPGMSENHWWDGVTGCAVAASMEGAGPKPATRVRVKKTTKGSFADRQRQRRGGAS